jgi:uncharacterized membrane protein
MKFREDNHHADSRTKIWPSTWFVLGIISAQILVSLLTYPFMPVLVPSHWNASGQMNGYMPRAVNAIFVPAISAGIYILLRILLFIAPRGGSNTNQYVLIKLSDYLLCGILLFLFAIQLVVTAAALGLPVDIGFIVCLATALLFIFLGNYLGKIQRNFWFGIRTPWTLADDTVWERTHRLGGWLLVGAGVVTLVMGFFAPLRFLAIIGPILLVAIILTGYSFLVYRRVRER